MVLTKRSDFAFGRENARRIAVDNFLHVCCGWGNIECGKMRSVCDAGKVASLENFVLVL